MTYSMDLRERVVSYINSGGQQTVAAKIFSVSLRTIHKWMHSYRATGEIKLLPRGGGPRSKVDEEKFKEYVKTNPDKTLEEIGAQFGISYEGARYNLIKHNFVYKKKSSLYRKKC